MQTIPTVRNNRLANFLLETSPVAIFVSSPAGIIHVVNPVAERWFGYEESELAGRQLEQLFPEDASSDNMSQYLCFLSHLRAPEPGKEWWLSARRRNGTDFLAKVTLHPITTIDGEMRLANVVKLSDHESRTEKHVQRERLAAVSQMVSGLSHESRNAMQRAESCLDLLEMDLVEDSETHQLTNRIREALHSIHRTYEDVREYAAPIILKRSSVDLRWLIRAVTDQWSRERRGETPKLHIECDAFCDSVSLDVDRFGVVLRHLLENALQASSVYQTIEIRCRRLDSGTGMLQICVRDHGSGLDEAVKRCLFEPFFTTKQQGTGLGLAVCRRIIEAHEGNIDASNHPGGGTVVRIRFPQLYAN